MTVFASLSRRMHRSRRTPSVASVVRSIGTVRISDQPDVWSFRPAHDPACATHGSAVVDTGSEVDGRSASPA